MSRQKCVMTCDVRTRVWNLHLNIKRMNFTCLNLESFSLFQLDRDFEPSDSDEDDEETIRIEEMEAENDVKKLVLNFTD